MACFGPVITAATPYSREWSALQAKLPVATDEMRKDREVGEYTDFTVVCDDGTVFKLHKIVVCPKVPAIQKSLKESFIEGQTREFQIKGKSSAIVKAFLDLIYGIPPQFPLQSTTPTVTIKSYHLAKMARIYALADYLLAEQTFAYTLEWFKIFLPLAIQANDPATPKAMDIVLEQSARPEPVLEVFINECASNLRSKHCNWETMIQWFKDMGHHKVLLLKKLLGFTKHDAMTVLSTEKLEPLLELDGVDAIIMRECNGYGPYNFDELWNHKEFCKELGEKGEFRAILDAEKARNRYAIEPMKHCLGCHFLLTTSGHLNACPRCNSTNKFVQVRGYVVLEDGRVKRQISIPPGN